MDTNEHASSQTACGGDKDVAIGLRFTGYRGLEVLGPGAVAHMSLHHNLTMSKSRPTGKSGQLSLPDFHRGTGCPICVGDRRDGGGENRQRRVGERASRRASGFGQALSAIKFQKT